MPTKITAKANFKKIPIDEAMEVATDLMNELKYYVVTLEIAGSIRQGKKQIGDIDMVIIPKDLDTFYDEVKNIIDFDYGATKKIFGLYKGRPINLFITTAESYGACLLMCTGPAMYNIHKRRLAKTKGYKLNEYGLFKRDTNEKVAGETEQSIYKTLGWDYKEPTERENPSWILDKIKNK